MDATQARARFAAAPRAVLATADAAGRPHLVPVCFALDGDTLLSAVDGKPKRTLALRRLANIEANPAVALLVDGWDGEDWSALWWARADGRARVLAPADPQARRAVELLAARYPQYRDEPPAGPVLAVAVERWSGWEASVSVS